MKFLFLIFSSCFLFACSSTQQAYIQNVKLYFDGQVGVSLSDQEIVDSPVDLLFIKSGQRPVATMALAFIERGRYKWLSSDNAMLITENGRIVRSLGFKNDLLAITNLSSDPLKTSFTGIGQSEVWQRYIDSEPDQFGVVARSKFNIESNKEIEIQGHLFTVDVVSENVMFDSVKHGKDEWQNTFWYHSETKKLLKSNQKVTPDSDVFDITYVSRALRLLEPSK
ncbi:MAG: lipoprotein GfcB [Aliiglaciecola sp.]